MAKLRQFFRAFPTFFSWKRGEEGGKHTHRIFSSLPPSQKKGIAVVEEAVSSSPTSSPNFGTIFHPTSREEDGKGGGGEGRGGGGPVTLLFFAKKHLPPLPKFLWLAILTFFPLKFHLQYILRFPLFVLVFLVCLFRVAGKWPKKLALLSDFWSYYCSTVEFG